MKGISREVVPYAVDAMVDEAGGKVETFSEHTTGLDLYLDPDVVDDQSLPHVRQLLADALAALDRRRRAAQG